MNTLTLLFDIWYSEELEALSGKLYSNDLKLLNLVMNARKYVFSQVISLLNRARVDFSIVFF